MNIRDLLLNALFLQMLGLFSVVIPIGSWQANPFWILLFARVYNVAFTDVHFTSVATISCVCSYLVIRDRNVIQPYRWVAVVFGAAGLHEWMLYLWDYILFGGGLANFWKDAVWFGAFIIVGVGLANREQRIVLGFIAAYLFVMMAVYVGAFHNSELEIGVYTSGAIADNFIEVIGWVTTPLAFLFIIPKRRA